MKYYMDRKKAVESHEIFLWGIDLAENEIKDTYLVYIGDELPIGYLGRIKVVDGKVSPATIHDAFEWGMYKLRTGEKFDDDLNLIKVEAPSDKYYWSNGEWLVDLPLLEDGEKVINNTIVTVDKPSKLFSWDKIKFMWVYTPEKYELQIGEKIVDEQLVRVPIPDGMEFPQWNHDWLIWEDKIPVQDLLKSCTKQLIDNELQLIAYERLSMNCTLLLDEKVRLQDKISKLVRMQDSIDVIGG